MSNRSTYVEPRWPVLLALAAVVAAFSSTSLSLVFSVPGALLCLGMLSTAPRFVSAIASSHRQALGRPG